jgi:hypothetical protein
MAWPVERDAVLSSAQLVSEWDESGEGEKEVRDILNTLTIDEGRAVVMARPDEFQRVFGAEGKSFGLGVGTLVRNEVFGRKVQRRLRLQGENHFNTRGATASNLF